MRIKFKLYTDERGQAQVDFFNPDWPTNHYWREDGKLSFLSVMSDDPESPMEQLGDGVFYTPKK